MSKTILHDWYHCQVTKSPLRHCWAKCLFFGQSKLNDHSPDALDTRLTNMELKNKIYHQLLERRSNEILLVIEGPRKKTSPSNFGKIEHCQKHSKFHMQVCLCVLYTDLYLISFVFAFLSIIIVCRNENKVLAAFILHSQPVV